MAKLITPLGRTGRVQRRPSHPFQLRWKPWQIQPFLCAPVLPGETLVNFMVQHRCVSDPMKNPFIGAWLEHHLFYVKHRDLDERDDLVEMVMDLEKDMSPLFTAADPKFYHYGTTIPWAELCLKRIVAEFFRTESDEGNVHEIDGVPIAYINQDTWLDSVINDADFVAPADEGVVEVADADPDTVGDQPGVMASDIDRAMRQWQFNRAHGLTEMDYEDFLRTYGVDIPKKEELHRPERLMSWTDWSYPTNTVGTSGADLGVPSTAFSWATRNRLDKDKFFKEPGFIVGVVIMRPKVYLRGQAGSAIGLLNDALSWLPAIMRDDPYTSLKKVAAASGPLAGNTDAYWVDLKDLFLYGEQFCNFSVADVAGNFIDLPTATLQKHFVDTDDIDGLFVDAVGGKNLIRGDGIATLNVEGALVDTTPPVNREFV